MQNFLTNRLQRRASALQRRRFATHQQAQCAIGCCIFAACHRRVEQRQTALGCQPGQLAHPRDRERAAFHQYRARFSAAKRAVLAQPHRPRGRVVADHGDDNAGTVGGFARRGGHARPTRGQRRGFCGGAVVHIHREAGLLQVRRHASAHNAQAKKRYRVHENPSLCSHLSAGYDTTLAGRVGMRRAVS